VSTSATPDPFAKSLDRVRKLIARAGGTDSPHERRTAAEMAVKQLEAHPAPIRWYVRPGTQVLVVPAYLLKDLGQAQRMIRRQANRNPIWFTEQHRVRGEGQLDAEVMSAGFLQFERHSYAVFVALKDVEAHL
jgi:hypothetical protein